MSYIADAHNDWHTVNGWDKVCPLDCGVGEGSDDYYIPEQEDPAEEGPDADDYVSPREQDEAAGRAEDRDFAAWGW